MKRNLLAITLISLIAHTLLISPVWAAEDVCIIEEADQGIGATKSPSQFFEVTVPAHFGDDEQALYDRAWEKLSQEIKYESYNSLLTKSMSLTSEGAWEKLRPPQEMAQNHIGQTSKAQVYVNACVEGTDRWFAIPEQDIIGENVENLSLTSQATRPLQMYLTRLPTDTTRLKNIFDSQTIAYNSATATVDGLPQMSLNLRPKLGETPNKTNIYFDLCVKPTATTCGFNQFTTEIEAGGELRVIVPGTYTDIQGVTRTWGLAGGSLCISSEQIPGLAPFQVSGGTSLTVTARIFGAPSPESSDQDSTCQEFAAEVSGSASKDNSSETVAIGTASSTVMCPGPYTPGGREFQSQVTCIAGSCIFRPLKIAKENAISLWDKLVDAINECLNSGNIFQCVENLFVHVDIPFYVYPTLAGGNYGAITNQTTKAGFDAGFNNLFRPPQEEFTKQPGQEPAQMAEADESNILNHSVGPTKAVYSEDIQCRYLTPPGQESRCDKSEAL